MASDAAPQSLHSSCCTNGMVWATRSWSWASRGKRSRIGCMSRALSGQQQAEQPVAVDPDLGLADHAVVERVLAPAGLERARRQVAAHQHDRTADRQRVADLGTEAAAC